MLASVGAVLSGWPSWEERHLEQVVPMTHVGQVRYRGLPRYSVFKIF